MDFDNYEMILIGIGEEFENNDKALNAYNKLAELLSDKNYFIVTLCMDDVIFKSSLNPEKIVAPMGGKRFKQCPDGCDKLLYSLDEEKCVKCGKQLVYNNILAENYVEDGYLPMWEKHKIWLTGTINKSLCVCELGVSMKFPQIVRWPFEKVVFYNRKADFIRVNATFPQLSAEIADKGKSIKANSVEWLNSL